MTSPGAVDETDIGAIGRRRRPFLARLEAARVGSDRPSANFRSWSVPGAGSAARHPVLSAARAPGGSRTRRDPYLRLARRLPPLPRGALAGLSAGGEHDTSRPTKTRWSPSGPFRAQGVEATTGFEPVNRGFADLRVEPLHHVARGGSSSGCRRMLAAPRGFEPRFTDSKSAVLPLDEGAAARESVWSGRRDSNPRPSPWQGDALPTEPLPPEDPPTLRWCREPDSNWRHRDFQSRALPTELSRPDGQPAVGCPSAGGTIPRASEERQRDGRLRRPCDAPGSPTPAPPTRPPRPSRAAPPRSARAAG